MNIIAKPGRFVIDDDVSHTFEVQRTGVVPPFNFLITIADGAAGDAGESISMELTRAQLMLLAEWL